MQIRLSYLNSTSSSPYLIPLAILSLIELSSSLAQSTLIHSSSTFCLALHLQVYSITDTRALPDCIISNYACTLWIVRNRGDWGKRKCDNRPVSRMKTAFNNRKLKEKNKTTQKNEGNKNNVDLVQPSRRTRLSIHPPTDRPTEPCAWGLDGWCSVLLLQVLARSSSSCNGKEFHQVYNNHHKERKSDTRASERDRERESQIEEEEGTRV